MPKATDQHVEMVTLDMRHPVASVQQRLSMVNKLAEGGMAEIYEAKDRNLGRRMAIKRLLPEHANTDMQKGRLIGEAQVIAQLDHPGIVPVHEVGEDADGELFYSMKLVRGQHLGEVLASQDPRFRSQDDLFELMQIFLKVCDAMAFAHSRGVIHRDVKPENIMVGAYGEVYLMDWGLVLPLTEKNLPVDGDTQRYSAVPSDKRIVGTPGYMAPEQAKGELDELDHRTDIWALGSVLYEIITGKQPVTGQSPLAVIYNTLHGDIPAPETVMEVPPQPELSRIVMKALAKEREDRYLQVEEMQWDLERFLRKGWQPPVRTYAPGASIILEGEQGDEAYIIVKGRCRVTKEVDGEDRLLRVMGEGEAFGEVALFADLPRTASVEAKGEVKLMVISRKQLEQEMGGGYFLGRFLKGLAGRFVDMDQRVSSALDEIRRRDLAADVLRHLATTGEDLNDAREAPWPPLEERLIRRYGWSGAHLREIVENIDDVEVAAGRGKILLKSRQEVWG